MKFSKQASNKIIQYIKDSMQPILGDEDLPRMHIAGTGKWSDWRRIQRWLMDILEGSATLIGNKDDYYIMVIKLKYNKGLTWREISSKLNMPESTLKDRTRRFFNKLVDDMPAEQGYEILRIIKRLPSLEREDNEERCELPPVTEENYRWKETVKIRDRRPQLDIK